MAARGPAHGTHGQGGTEVFARLGIVVGLNLFTNDLSELFGRLRGLQAAIEVDRRLNAPMPQQPPDRFIVAPSVL